MKTTLHTASSRGYANHLWLEAYHSFSFANYHNPERMQFGALRVLNDDCIAPNRGFDTHPHANMEIISIPLAGALTHSDSMGNSATIKAGEVQVMSAGSGVQHSEYNRSKDQEVRLLQIWLYPRENGVTPRYDQISIKELAKPNEFFQILSPNPDDQGVWIHQDAWFHLGYFEAGNGDKYSLKKKDNGVYLFVLEGSVEISGAQLTTRDGLAITDCEAFELTSVTSAKVLLMEVPIS